MQASTSSEDLHMSRDLNMQEASSSNFEQGLPEAAFASTSTNGETEHRTGSAAESDKDRPAPSKLSPDAKPFQPQGLHNLAKRLAMRQRHEAANLAKQQALEHASGEGMPLSFLQA